MKRFIAFLLHPASLVFVPFLMSFAAWMVPGHSLVLRGYEVRSELTAGGLLLLVLWYLIIATVATVSFRAGSSVRGARVFWKLQEDQKTEKRWYSIMTAVASVGVIYALSRAGQTISIVESLASNDGNALSEALDSSAGLSTLRYASAVAAPIGVYLLLQKRANVISVVWNMAMLLANAAFTSRLSLVLAVVIFLYIQHRRGVKLRFSLIVAVGFVAVSGLTVLNYVRNARFYETWGVTNPIEMSWHQALTYLSAPFQVSLGVANGLLDGTFTPKTDLLLAGNAVRPTFFGSGLEEGLRGSARYDYVVDISTSLTTNSAFADSIANYGVWSLGWLVLVVGITLYIAGYFTQFNSVLLAIPAICLYGLAEFWRLFLFNQGILVFLVVFGAVAAVVAVGLTTDGGTRANRSSA